jgi:nucleotide-binding universal stress UspA family protein
MSPIRTILHPTDFSGHAEYAFHMACCLARDQGARVIVLHVGEQPPTPPDRQKALEEQLRRVQAPDVKVSVEHRLEQGAPDSEILRVAQETSCDLIVMGTQGKMGVGQTVLPGRWVGSVAGKVLRGATCPVMAVKTPEAGAQPS